MSRTENRPDKIAKQLFFIGLAGLPWLWIVNIFYFFERVYGRVNIPLPCFGNSNNSNSDDNAGILGLMSSDDGDGGGEDWWIDGWIDWLIDWLIDCVLWWKLLCFQSDFVSASALTLTLTLDEPKNHVQQNLLIILSYFRLCFCFRILFITLGNGNADNLSEEEIHIELCKWVKRSTIGSFITTAMLVSWIITFQLNRDSFGPRWFVYAPGNEILTGW